MRCAWRVCPQVCGELLPGPRRRERLPLCDSDSEREVLASYCRRNLCISDKPDTDRALRENSRIQNPVVERESSIAFRETTGGHDENGRIKMPPLEAYALHMTLDFMALVFFYSAIAKFLLMNSFKTNLLMLPGINTALAAGIAWIIPLCEIVLAIMLFLNNPWGKILSICLLVIFSLVAAVAVRSGRRIPCGCFGGDSEVLSVRTILRNMILVGILGFTFLLHHRTLWYSSVFSTVVLLLLCATMWSVIDNERAIRSLKSEGLL